MKKNNLFNSVSSTVINKDEILSKINRRQAQILLHSCIYYKYATSIISDATFDSWAKELVKLRKDYPDIAFSSRYNNRFINFDGTTGFNLYTEDFDAKARWFIDNEKST